MKIGLVGLGRMGSAIAQRLTEQGCEIVAWDHAEKRDEGGSGARRAHRGEPARRSLPRPRS